MSAAPDAATIESVQMGELACWRVRTQWAEALIATQGAQLLSYTPHGQPPIVWLSEDAKFLRGQPLRGGVPVCWPWFGDLARNPQPVRDMFAPDAAAPAHGVVRGVEWEPGAATAESGRVVMDFHCHMPNGSGEWKHPADLLIRFRMGETLEIQLCTHNFGDAPITVSQALHTYFAVSDSRQITIEGLEDTTYIDTMRNWEPVTQTGPIRIEGETDRIYTGIDRAIEIVDPGWQRRIHIEASQSRSAVVWNPWVEKAARLSQFPDDAWQRMVCIETARVWDDVLVVAPGKTESMSVTIRVDAAAPAGSATTASTATTATTTAAADSAAGSAASRDAAA